MFPVLPLELQLRIIELAVPPLTKRNLGKVRRLSTRLPLVCRSWRDFAYRVVPVVPRFTITCEGRDWDDPDPETILDAVAASGRVVREVELDLKLMEDDIEVSRFNRVLRGFEEVWLDLPADETNSANSLDTVNPSIRRLVFTTWQGADLDLSNIWPFTPNLEILGIAVRPPYSGCFEWDVFEGSRASNTVRHVCLQFAYDRKTGRCTLFDPDLFSLALPPSLLTLTVRHPSILTSGQRSVITAACQRNDTIFVEQVYTLAPGQKVDGWDIEEWALSVT
ncbi:hypothetical protein Rhopal_006967-T1 [Rhodotorula paludigena]|uniref:F-box domain-containing protein n=1 Tax=Rhodotorula paludigena TaxID=86838 RepID=A0AAV5GZI8_9BASI|nr:hypothetical protein Rhopal_006967-T1 [Rhodotorula paludigena]